MKKVILFKSDFSRHFLSNYFVSLIAASLLLLPGCGSDKADNSADLSLKIPQYQSISNGIQSNASIGQLSHIFISITGPNIAVPISYEWSQCKECTTQLPAPTSFKLGVPTGDSRLIQVLVVYEDQATDSTGLFYGDTTQSLVSGDNAVGVNVSAILKTTNLVEGRIAGRYIDRIDSVTVAAVTTPVAFGPTSEVLIKYKPLNKPAMTIDRSSIVNGWFNLFALKDVNFNYELPNGTVLFNNVNLDSFKPQAAGSVPGRYAHVWFPQHFRKYDAASPGEKEGEKINIVGWFGSAALPADFKVCASSTATVDYLFEMSGTSSSTTNNLNMTVVAALTPPTSSTISVYGAVTGCTGYTSQLLSTVQFLGPESFNQGNDSVGGFRGLFSQFRDAANTHYTYSEFQNTAPTTLKFKLLPGVPLVTTSIEHWQTSLTPSQGFHFDNVPCRAIRSGLITGFTKLSTTPTTVGQLDLSVPFRAVDQNALNVFCPVFNNFTLDTGFVMYPQNASNSATMSLIATRDGAIEAQNSMNSISTQTSYLTDGICHKLQVKFYQGGTQINSSSETVSLTAFTGGYATTSANCSTGGASVTAGTQIMLPYSGTDLAHQIYFKTSAGGASAFYSNFGINLSSVAGIPIQNPRWNFNVAQPVVFHNFLNEPEIKYSTSACYKTPISLNYSTLPEFSIPTVATDGLSKTVNYDSAKATSCTGTLSGPLSNSPITGYFMPAVGSLSYRLVSTLSTNVTQIPFNVTGFNGSPSSPSFLYMRYRKDLSAQNCKAIEFQSIDSGLVVFPTIGDTSYISAKVGAASRNIYSSLSACMSNSIPMSSVQVTEPNFFKKFMYIDVGTGATQLEITSGNTPLKIPGDVAAPNAIKTISL